MKLRACNFFHCLSYFLIFVLTHQKSFRKKLEKTRRICSSKRKNKKSKRSKRKKCEFPVSKTRTIWPTTKIWDKFRVNLARFNMFVECFHFIFLYRLFDLGDYPFNNCVILFERVCVNFIMAS